MNGKLNRILTAVAVLLLSLVVYRFGVAQSGVEGMEAPTDVTGADCRMCHTGFAEGLEFTHEPAAAGDCVSCHLTTGETGHGGLVSEDRELCLTCHSEQREHYPVATCWTSGCHSDVHGSDIDMQFIASRAEEYPGFFESTQGAEYVGSASCLACHCENCDWWGQSVHSLSDGDENTPLDRQGCEACHGPGGNHWGRLAGIGRFEFAYADESDAMCLKCHRDEMYMPDYEGSSHFEAHVTCVSCHSPHNLTNKANLKLAANEVCLSCHETKRADFMRLSHHPLDTADARTGMLCIDCHTPHGSTNTAMLVRRTDELCQVCHVDKAGPFVYSHAGYDPALGRGCATCHSHHGSNSPNLLVMNGRGLCLQCHTDMATNHGGNATCWTSGCHSDHHGSNSNYFFVN